MKVEIWSDIMCPFCYIGKKRFEKALERFEKKEEVEIIWKSFQLNPDLETNPNKNINEYLAEIKGWDLDQAKTMNGQVAQMAKEEGLFYDFNGMIVANTFDAHRFIQYAKDHGKGNEMEERLFCAYFSEAKDISSYEVLLELAAEIGLDKEAARKQLVNNAFAEEVRRDIQEAYILGIRAVPFFVVNRKYGISGAQSAETFLEALQEASMAK